MKIKYEPVAWLTGIATVLVGLAGTTAITNALPARMAGALTMAAAGATLILGVLTRDKVTSLARPRDALGRPLVPDGVTGSEPI